MGRMYSGQHQRQEAAGCPLLLHGCTMLHADDTMSCRTAVSHHHTRTLLKVDRNPCMLLPTLQALGGPMAVA